MEDDRARTPPAHCSGLMMGDLLNSKKHFEKSNALPQAVVLVAVLPEYRASFLKQLKERLQSDVELHLIAGDVHLDETVRSSAHDGVVILRNRHFLGRTALWQRAALRHARAADVLVVDLNPRSLTAWVLLLRGRLRGKRVLVWGHIHPRKGPGASTAPLRRRMRRLADGVISYTWGDAQAVRVEDPDTPVWVAANGLYAVDELGFDDASHRDGIVYVGRLEKSKKPELLVRAFARALPSLPDDAHLEIVGDGAEREALEALVAELGMENRTAFRGHVGGREALRDIYRTAVASVSPGYAGLSLTQSLGFGVPMIVADEEPHAPEIELLAKDTGVTFRADDVDSLTQRLVEAFAQQETWDRRKIVDAVAAKYSSTAMAEGFARALTAVPMED